MLKRFYHAECPLKIDYVYLRTRKDSKSKNPVKSFLPCYHCLKHNKTVCRCGWEFGHHQGLTIKKK